MRTVTAIRVRRYSRGLGHQPSAYKLPNQKAARVPLPREPILSMTKIARRTAVVAEWANNSYRLRPITGLAMFNESENDAAATEPRRQVEKSSMSPEGDTQLATSVSRYGVTQRPGSMSPSVSPCMSPTGDTNQIEPDRTITLNVNGFKKSLSEGKPANDSLPGEEEIRVSSLVLEMLDVCRDKHSRGFYRPVAQKVPEDLIRAALSETKYQDRMGRITESRGAFFTDQLRRLARERGIKLAVKVNGPEAAFSADNQPLAIPSL